MPHFDSSLHKDVVDLICDSRRFTPDAWRMWLEPCLDKSTLDTITWQGSPRDFASHLTLRLNHEQLIAALIELRHESEAGIEMQARIDEVRRRIEEHRLTPIVDGRPNALLQRYHERCRAQWQYEPYVLQDRFVKLVLLPRDDEPERAGARKLECDDLRELLKETTESTILLRGKPGGGKSTLLRRLQWDAAGDALDQPEQSRITFFAELNRYRLEHNDPRQWLAARWQEFAREMPALDALLDEGRVLLLLDGLNEMRCAGADDYRRKVEQWQEFMSSIAPRGNRAVFTCRDRDYPGGLESNAAPMAVSDVQPMSRKLIRQFLDKYIPERAGRVFEQIDRDDRLLDLYSTPYFLSLLIRQVDAKTGDIPSTRARLFTGFVRHALREEVKRGTRLIATDASLLHERDKTDLEAGNLDPYWLPRRGLLISKLSALAFEMQERYKAGGSQVALEYDEAIEKLGDRADDLITAGRHIKMLDEVSGSGQIKFFHQLLQEYFAARELARQPERASALVRAAWRNDEISEPYAQWLATKGQDPRAQLPQLDTSGWEETMRMAAEMVADPEAFVSALMPANLPLAGECAAAIGKRISATLREELRWALVRRSQDLNADLRARIRAGLALGPLGDPRFTRAKTRDFHREVLIPPMVFVPGGTYIIGTDKGRYADEGPAHPVEIKPFTMSAFPVTNAEYKCFIDDGGYTTDEWWDTPAALAWRKGEADSQALIDDYLSAYRRESNFDEKEIQARWPEDPDFAETLIYIKTLSDDELIALFHKQLSVSEAATKPRFWDDPAYNNPTQPVVGVCWFEARAYCNWLSAHAQKPLRLPSEAEWEAAARGAEGRQYAYAGDFDPNKGNTLESRIRATTPVGLYSSGAVIPVSVSEAEENAPLHIYDLTGNVWEWTSTLYARYDDESVMDRENPASDGKRVLRGGSWFSDSYFARAVYRLNGHPSNRNFNVGFRVVVSAPVP